MESVSTPEAPFQFYLLASFSLGLLLSVKCLVQIAFPHLRVVRSVEWASGLAAGALAFILCLDYYFDGSALGENPFRSLIFIGSSAAFVSAHLGVSVLQSRRRRLVLQPVAWLAVALTLAATTWSSHRYNIGNLRIELDATFGIIEGELDSIRDWVAVTDRGREVTLYRWVNHGLESSAAETAATELADLKANCHGWVFTSGQHLLWRDGVERILEDNGYQICEVPRPGDLIIYRNVGGEIIHTGLVKAGLFGTLIESKWGLSKRFVHSPEMQPYGNQYSFYRSSRHGHALTIRPAKPTMSIASR